MKKKTHICFLLTIGILCLAAGFLYIALPVFRFSGQVLMLFAGIAAGFYLLAILRTKVGKWGKYLFRFYTLCICVGFAIAFVTGGVILYTALGDPGQTCDYVIVLGAGVRGDVPSLSLQDRINGAYDYLTAHPDVVCIASGGQGEGENLSEAACIFRELTAMGIPEERILLEDQSTSTMENLQFSMEVLKRNGVENPGKVGILSSEYHLLRAGMFANKLGIDHMGVPARTSRPGIFLNYFVREIVAIWFHILFGVDNHG